MEFYTTVLLSVVALVMLVIIVKSPIFQTSMLKKHKKLNDEYIKDLEDEKDFFKKKARAMQLQANVKEQGVKVDPNGGFEEIVPEIIKGISPFIPEKLRPIFEDKEISGAIIQQVLKNPAQYKDVITNMISKVKVNGNKETGNTDTASL